MQNEPCFFLLPSIGHTDLLIACFSLFQLKNNCHGVPTSNSRCDILSQIYCHKQVNMRYKYICIHMLLAKRQPDEHVLTLQMYTHKHTQTHTNTNTHTPLSLSIYTHTHTHTHTHTTHKHTLTHLYIYIYIYI